MRNQNSRYAQAQRNDAQPILMPKSYTATWKKAEPSSITQGPRESLSSASPAYSAVDARLRSKGPTTSTQVLGERRSS